MRKSAKSAAKRENATQAAKELAGAGMSSSIYLYAARCLCRYEERQAGRQTDRQTDIENICPACLLVQR